VQTISAGQAEFGRIPPWAAAWVANVVGLSVAAFLGLRLMRGSTAEARK
jgi:lipopolysaccharide export LptBFGC system permease protein LptF